MERSVDDKNELSTSNSNQLRVSGPDVPLAVRPLPPGLSHSP